MEHESEILKIIQAGLEGDDNKLRAYADLLRYKLTEDDSLQIAIKNLLDGSYKNQPHIEGKLHTS